MNTIVDDLLLITNARAGSANDETVDKVVAALRRQTDVEVAATASAEELDGIVKTASDRRVVVLGGDGSLHAVVRALHRNGLREVTEVALVPMGTGNDLARSLGIPLEPMAAAQLALNGVSRSLDMLEDDAGGIVINAAHIGIGAEAAQKGEAVKHTLGPAGYAVGATVAGLTTGGWDLRVESDGTPFGTHSKPLLMVALSLGQSIGGGTPVAPHADIEDGKADLMVSSASGPLARVGFGRDLRKGQHVDRDDVLTTRAREVCVSGESFPVNADGEVEVDITERTWRVLPAAWEMVTPPPRYGPKL
ncbi:MAG: diacylglycerol kinase family protein [Candidatus Nanopelagicales bacterium]